MENRQGFQLASGREFTIYNSSADKPVSAIRQNRFDQDVKMGRRPQSKNILRDSHRELSGWARFALRAVSRAVSAAGVCSSIAYGQAAAPAILWDAKVGLPLAAPITAADVNLDGALDIVVIGTDKQALLLDGAGRSVQWEATVRSNDKTPYAAAAGHFLGDGSMDIAILSEAGELKILDGATGDELLSANLGFTPADAPTVFPANLGESTSDLARDGLAVLGSTGTLVGYRFSAGQGPQMAFQHDLGGVYDHSVAVGKTGFDRPAPHFIAVASDGQVSVATLATGHREKVSFQIDRGISRVWSAIGDLNGDGTDDVAIADDSGYLYAVTVRGEAFEPLWDKISIEAKPVFAPVVIDVNGDGKQDLLIPKDERQYLLVNGATGGRGIWTEPSYNHDGAMRSPPAVFYGADNRAYAVLTSERTDGDTLGVLDLAARNLKMDGQNQPLRIEISGYAATSPVVGKFDDGNEIAAFALGWREGGGSLVGLGLALAPSRPQWLGYGGNGWRTGGLSSAHAKYTEAQRAALIKSVETRIAEAKAMLETGDTDGATQKLLEAANAAPKHPEAEKMLKGIKLRGRLPMILLGTLIAFAALGFAGWKSYGTFASVRRRRQIVAALQKGNKERAVELMLLEHSRAPYEGAALKTFADLLIETGQVNAKGVSIFEKVRELNPGQLAYTRALAVAYEASGRQDATAAAIYEVMMRDATPQGREEAGHWAWQLGQTWEKLGETEKATRAYREAARHQSEKAEATRRLADLYVKLDQTNSEALPLLAPLIPERENDRDFLRLYCRGALAERKFDDAAQRAARAMTKLDPSAPEPHVILGSTLLQAGEIKEAMHHAEAVLQSNPNDSIGLRLLGACYAAENRLDDSAMGIFKRALDANPEAHEILIAVSKAYIRNGREDEEARLIYDRALAANPDDETLLKHVAESALKRADDDATILAVERLLKLGHHSRQLVLQLADAYCRKSVTDDRAEPIYKEALLFQSDHATVAANLATIYARHGRLDAEAIAVYEAVYHRDPARRDIGRMLAAGYHKAELADRTLAITQKLLADDPNDHDMKRLQAHASAALDNMDSAIQGFEQVLERNPEDMESICQLAILYGRKRLSDQNSLKIYQRAARTMKDNLDVHAALARAWAKQGNWEQVVAAIKHFLSHSPKQIGAGINLMEELVEGAPKGLDLRWFLVDTLTYDGRLRDAERHLIEILRLQPEENKRALACFDKILDKNTKNPVAHQYRGRILKDMGRISEARQALELAHRYRPADEGIARDLMDLYEKQIEKSDSPDVRFQLGRLAMITGKYDLAISCFQRTDKDPRWEKPSIKSLARCFMSKGMLDLALQELRRVQMDDEVKEILYELGQRYEAVNDIRGAREVYKAIFAVDITYQDVKGKLESLESRQQDVMTAERTAIINALSDQAKARYELIEELGRGAMGIVYKARDNELDEVVALKILPESLGNNPEALRRFRQEARNARHLSHPGIVRIHDIGEEMGRKYISMEFVSGGDLKQRIIEVKRKLPFSEALEYSRQICGAMIAAHEAGIVHRDLKPANIMITKDRKVKITDFGIAKAMEDDTRASQESTRVGSIVGTPLYMSPEQVQGTPVDYRSDIYSLGVMFYEMAMGYPPFTEGDLAYHHVFSPPKPMQGCNPHFARIILKCLSKKPDERWQSVREMFDELKKVEA